MNLELLEGMDDQENQEVLAREAQEAKMVSAETAMLVSRENQAIQDLKETRDNLDIQ